MTNSTVDLLKTEAKGKRTFSAYLLTGEDSERKKQLATDFARALNCEEQKCFAPCECASCRKILSGSHPDVRWYGLDEDENSIKIEAVRDLQSWLALKPYEGRRKVFILNEAGRLTGEAQNALLKDLEEPPPDTVMILLTQKRADLFDTVVSRLREIKVTPYSEREMIDILSKEGVAACEARFLFRFSQGNLQSARTMAGASWFKEKDQLLKILSSDTISGFEKLVSKKKKELLEPLGLLLAYVRDACCVRAGAPRGLLVDEERSEALSRFVEDKSAEELFDLYDAVDETRRAVEENVNPKLALARLQVIWRRFAVHER